MKELTPEIERIIYTMLWALIQHGNSDVRYEGGKRFVLSHQCMSAGESLCDLLGEYGLAEDDGWDLVGTPALLEILEKDL